MPVEIEMMVSVIRQKLAAHSLTSGPGPKYTWQQVMLDAFMACERGSFSERKKSGTKKKNHRIQRYRTLRSHIRIVVSSVAIVLSGEYAMTVQEYDEWIKKLPSGKKVRFSYQLLTTGFSASAEILEPVDSMMIYTHTHTDLPAPSDRAQIEAEFGEDLTFSGHSLT